MGSFTVGDKVTLGADYPFTDETWMGYPHPPIGAEGVVIGFDSDGCLHCLFEGYPDGLDDTWYIFPSWLQGERTAAPLEGGE